jgi:hypothetical protein
MSSSRASSRAAAAGLGVLAAVGLLAGCGGSYFKRVTPIVGKLQASADELSALGGDLSDLEGRLWADAREQQQKGQLLARAKATLARIDRLHDGVDLIANELRPESSGSPKVGDSKVTYHELLLATVGLLASPEDDPLNYAFADPAAEVAFDKARLTRADLQQLIAKPDVVPELSDASSCTLRAPEDLRAPRTRRTCYLEVLGGLVRAYAKRYAGDLKVVVYRIEPDRSGTAREGSRFLCSFNPVPLDDYIRGAQRSLHELQAQLEENIKALVEAKKRL